MRFKLLKNIDGGTYLKSVPDKKEDKTMPNDMKKVHIQLKARDLAERALLAYWHPDCSFHTDQFNTALDAMQDAIADYQTETLDDKEAI